MRSKARIVIVGAGNLGSALAVSLRRAGYVIESVVARSRGRSLKKAEKLARKVGARATTNVPARMTTDLVWLCVPDSEIARTSRALSEKGAWKGRVVLHSSGALSSDELAILRAKGAAVASAHPLMTFVGRSNPSLAGVPFAVEGDAAALRTARRIIRDLGGHAYPIRKSEKAAYHAWGTFASPLLTALLATSEKVAAAAGVLPAEARRRMIPILLQTLANYAGFGAPGAFSGPIVRGDVDTVARHMRVLARIPEARAVYVALANAALRYLPVRNQKELRETLQSARK